MLGKSSKVSEAVQVGGAWLAAAVGAAVIAWADPAQACSYALPPPSLVGYPMNGDADVPVDVVPVYEGPAAHIMETTGTGSASFGLRSASGALIEVTPVHTFQWSIELIPERELESETAYTIEATLKPFNGGGTTMVTVNFRTGSERAAAPSVPTDAFLQHYRLAQENPTSCSPESAGTCIAFVRGPIAATSIDQFHQEHTPAYLFWDPTNFSELAQGQCFKLRARARNGVLSEPVERCAAGAPLVELEGDHVGCTAQGVTGDAASDGCSVAVPSAPRRAEPGSLLLALALSSVLIRRRRGEAMVKRGVDARGC